VAGYIPRWYAHPEIVTHPSTNRARLRVTSLIHAIPLLLCCALVALFFRTVFLDRDWFTLETASTLIANHSGLLHVRVPTPAASVEPAEAVDQQQKGKQKPTKQQKPRDPSPPPPPSVPLSPLDTAAAALSGTNFVCYRGGFFIIMLHEFLCIIVRKFDSQKTQTFVTGPPTHSVGAVWFRFLTSVVVCRCRLSSSVTLHGGLAGGFTHAGQQ